MGVFMADPPNAAAAVALPHALARGSPPNTTACRRREHGRGSWTTGAVVFRDPDRSGTIARGCLSRNGGACRAAEVPDCRMCPADRSAETTHRTFDECLRYPNGCPSWRRTNTRTLLVLSNVADVCRCSLQARCKSMYAKALDESYRTWRHGSSTPPPSDRHLEARGYVLHRGVDPKRSAARIDSNRPTVAIYRAQSDKAS